MHGEVMKFHQILLGVMYLLSSNFVAFASNDGSLMMMSNFSENRLILDQGIKSFLESRFDDALEQFNTVLEYSHSKSENYGTALWGRALCHVILEDELEIDADIIMLTEYSLCCKDCKESLLLALSDPSTDIPQAVPVNLFAEDNENISISECKQRANALARSIGELIDKKLPSAKDSLVRPKFKNFINYLTNEAYRCCESGNRWAACLESLAVQWREWKKAGIPQEPTYGGNL